MLTNNETLPFASWNQKLFQLELEYSDQYEAVFYKMIPNGLPNFTPELLSDINTFQTKLANFISHCNKIGTEAHVKYLVHSSGIDNIFNLGGDLDRFSKLIHAQDRNGLMQYATACINVLYTNHINLGHNISTIALLEGTAAGGGFEAALSSDVIIAEKGVEMGFPEAIFNLFPGMGAYSFLARRIAPTLAEKIIKTGRMYSAEYMHEIGIVDVLAEPGEAHIALQRYLKDHHKYANMHQSMEKVKERVHPISYQELMDITSIWVDAAMQLPETNIRTMERLVKAQTYRTQKQTHPQQATYYQARQAASA
jgi:DSF synthase